MASSPDKGTSTLPPSLPHNSPTNASPTDTITASLSSLHIAKPATKPSPPNPTKKTPIADSWEEDSSGDDNDGGERKPPPPRSSSRTPISPSAPPATPTAAPSTSSASSIAERFGDWSPSAAASGGEARRAAGPERRQEKTDAVARRMIAGALGVRAPKKTEEQRAYDRALREKEMRRRNQEKEDEVRRKEEAERARAAVWED